jgi:hypothetical protein
MKKENYLCLNGKKIELTKEQLAKIRNSISKETKLSEKAVGDIVTIGEHEYIVLEQNEFIGTTSLLMKDLLEDSVVFGDTADYKTSKVKKLLDEFALELEKEVGEDNLIEHNVDLTSDDGLKDYGKTTAKVSLLTCDLYRKFVYIIDKFKLDKWWWLATAFSTPKHGYEKFVECVSPRGGVNYYSCGYFGVGVRPFCILNSNIFVS